MQGLNVVALVKGEERYVFLYDDCLRSQQALAAEIRAMVASPEFSLVEEDAAAMAQRIEQLRTGVSRHADDE